MDHFGRGCTRWQLGDGGVSIPPWSVLGGAMLGAEAIHLNEVKRNFWEVL